MTTPVPPETTPSAHPGDAPDVLVVGGGIGGLATAFALARQGVAVRVLERAKEFGEVGAGIQLAPNCTRILEEFGLLDEAKARGCVPKALVMKDALDGEELTRIDLGALERRYGTPYLVIHRSDLHRLFLDACRAAGVDLRTDAAVTGYENTPGGARVTLADGTRQEAGLVVAADGLHSVAREHFVGDDVVDSRYVAYRAAVPREELPGKALALDSVVVHVGPHCHFVQYPLRGGEMLNQVAVFASPGALAGAEEFGTPEELDAAFAGTCDAVRDGIPLMWRDRRWPMRDREPVETWVHGRVALLGDAAHPPLQYMAQGAIMAIEDGWVLGQHLDRLRTADGAPDWDAALVAYEAVRVEHCRRVLTTARAWGALWHLEGTERLRRNAILRARAHDDWSFTDWIYGPTALTPDEEAAMFTPIPLDSADLARTEPEAAAR
ncbi:FAD-dependent oxidoreductase [Streptomyces sp. P6-2-1]|uniref:FAD-dependent oxidoreductase n=1 Tax=Streptomyces sp. P6-2-1 TaxID=3422591 RepID=UPI003D35F466